MLWRSLHILPLSLIILIPVTFIVTYSISVHWKHVIPIRFPYISETGTLSPESCVFAQFLNIASLLLGCCVYVRHRQIEQWRKQRGRNLVSRETIMITSTFGFLACLGLDVAANFPEARIIAVHMAGAILCFTASMIYFCMQTYLSYKIVKMINSWMIAYIRTLLSLLMIILTILTILPGYISMSEFHGDDYKNWTPSDGGWGWHVISAISEWLLAIVYCLFLLTFVPEFRQIHFEAPRIELRYLDAEKNLPEI